MSRAPNRYIDKQFLQDLSDKFGQNITEVAPEESVETSLSFMRHQMLLNRVRENNPKAFNDYLRELAHKKKLTQNASEEEIIDFQASVLDHNNHHLLQKCAQDENAKLLKDINKVTLDELFQAAKFDKTPNGLPDDAKRQLQTSVLFASEIGGPKAESALASRLSCLKNGFLKSISDPKVQSGLAVATIAMSASIGNPIGIASGVRTLLNTSLGKKFTDTIGHASERFLVDGVGIPQSKIDSAKQWFTDRYEGLTNNKVFSTLKYPAIAAGIVTGAAFSGAVYSDELKDIVSTLGDKASTLTDVNTWNDLSQTVKDSISQTGGPAPDIDASEFSSETTHNTATAQDIESTESTTTARDTWNELTQVEKQSLSQMDGEVQGIDASEFSQEFNVTSEQVATTEQMTHNGNTGPEPSSQGNDSPVSVEQTESQDCNDVYEQAFTHKVESGDTLSGLVAEKYENLTGEKPTQGQIWNMVYDVAAHNNIANVDLIHVGDTIVFPEGMEFTNEKFTPSVAMADGAASAYNIYSKVIVEPGQSLSSIAARHYEALTDKLPSQSALAELTNQIASHNNIENPDHLRIGQTISFPERMELSTSLQDSIRDAQQADCHTMNELFHHGLIDKSNTLTQETSAYYERLTGEKLTEEDANKLAQIVADHNNIEDIESIQDGTLVAFPSDLELQAGDVNLYEHQRQELQQEYDEGIASLNESSSENEIQELTQKFAEGLASLNEGSIEHFQETHQDSYVDRFKGPSS